MDMNNNVVCNITRRIPDFDVPCRDYTPAQTPTFGKLKARMLYYNAVISLKILRKTKQEVTLKLMQKGVTQYEASYVVAQISGEDVNPEFKAQRRKEAVKNLISGALWCVGGLIVTAITYAAAADGGTYIVAYGAIFWGGLQFLKGIGQLF